MRRLICGNGMRTMWPFIAGVLNVRFSRASENISKNSIESQKSKFHERESFSATAKTKQSTQFRYAHSVRSLNETFSFYCLNMIQFYRLEIFMSWILAAGCASYVNSEFPVAQKILVHKYGWSELLFVFDSLAPKIEWIYSTQMTLNGHMGGGGRYGHRGNGMNTSRYIYWICTKSIRWNHKAKSFFFLYFNRTWWLVALEQKRYRR